MSVCVSVCLWHLLLGFFKVLLLQFTKVKSQIDQLQKDSVGKSYEKTLLSDFDILASKLSKIAAQKKNNFNCFKTVY